MSIARDSVDTLTDQDSGSLRVALATTDAEIEASQRLRYAIFGVEMGAKLRKDAPGRDIDEFDPHCEHLLVTDMETGQLAGSARLLRDTGAEQTGMFYSESEFDLGAILALPGRFMEVGRTCIHRDYRTGAAIRTLWNGIAQQVMRYDVDYLIGCASLPMDGRGAHAQAIVDRIRDNYFTPAPLRVTPNLPLPEARSLPAKTTVVLPALLKAYLRLGARVAGEACWDTAFNVADVFILLQRKHLEPRYARTFLEGT